MHIGEKLKLYRKKLDLDQPQMAARMGVSYRTYQEIERTGIIKKAKDIAMAKSLLGEKEQVSAQVETQKRTDALTSGDNPITLNDYINELKENNKFLQALLMKNADEIGASVKAISSGLIQSQVKAEATAAKVSAAIDVSLKSLARLEKKPEGSLLDEKDNVLQHRYLKSQKGGIGAGKHK